MKSESPKPAPQDYDWLSALADGDVHALDGACGLWRDDAAARKTWHAYHLIGDVMRSEEPGADSDARRQLPGPRARASGHRTRAAGADAGGCRGCPAPPALAGAGGCGGGLRDGGRRDDRCACLRDAPGGGAADVALTNASTGPGPSRCAHLQRRRRVHCSARGRLAGGFRQLGQFTFRRSRGLPARSALRRTAARAPAGQPRRVPGVRVRHDAPCRHALDHQPAATLTDGVPGTALAAAVHAGLVPVAGGRRRRGCGYARRAHVIGRSARLAGAHPRCGQRRQLPGHDGLQPGRRDVQFARRPLCGGRSDL